MKLIVLFFMIIFILVIFITIKDNHSTFSAQIKGNSMTPTFTNGQKISIQKDIQKINRFDVIIFNHIGDKYIKRVVGLPGEEVCYQGGVLYINDRVVSDPFIKGNENFSLYDISQMRIIPAQKYFVLGDNRDESSDSRHYGLIDEREILGLIPKKGWKK